MDNTSVSGDSPENGAGRDEPGGEGRARPVEVADRQVVDDLLKTMGPEMAGAFLDTVLADLQALAAKLKAAGARDDGAEIRAEAHVLVALAGALGATGLSNEAAAVHAVARSADAAGLGVRALELGVAVDGLIVWVRLKKQRVDGA